jgi:uncharacterized protein (DUF58 family)
MGMTYTNNMVFVVCFYLTVMGLAMAKMTNDHVDSVWIEKVFVKDAFNEADQLLYVVIQNTTKKTLREIKVRISREKYIVKVDLKPEESQTVEILWTPKKRGLQCLPTVRIQSSYPAGLFGAWKVFREAEEGLIYPAKKGSTSFPDANASSHDSIGILREIRDYQSGDSPKRIHWRSLAKVGKLRTLVHEGDEGQVCQFNWNQVQHLDLETRLEQLALWITSVDAKGTPWLLQLPKTEFHSTNPNALKSALKELALWK